jgi:formamidopyrimidine-DNA glycosylase
MTAFMRQKLAYTQGITEGLSLEQFDLVTKNAVKLRDMTQTNVWTRVVQPEYARLTKEYQGTIEALYKAGTERQLKAATEAYAQTLRSCVECHRVLRAETIKGRN